MRRYACIDLKSFYASCECVEKGLNPLTTNLVVADLSRTEKTICLAVTPSLKAYGLSGRSRLYEVVQKVKEINEIRKSKNNNKFTGKSYNSIELDNNINLALDYIVSPPRMALYMKYSTNIYNIYLKYFSKDDMFVYSIDEVFFDITDYLKLYKKDPKDLITTVITDVYNTTGITATGGIGTNLYLAKIAMDIVAKHTEANGDGVRIAELDIDSYKKLLWAHEPITDFWRVGKGTANRLKEYGMYTMGDVARKSIENPELLYKLFGVNAELLIDHAWGYEPCTVKDVKNYKPNTTSLSQGQVLTEPYDYKKAKIIVREMTEILTLDLVAKGYITDHITLTIGYDVDNLKNKNIKTSYNGEVVFDHYGRKIPKSSHGSIRIDHKTSSTNTIVDYIVKLYDKIVNPLLLIRRINIAVCNLDKVKKAKNYKQLDIFNYQENFDNKIKEEKEELKAQQTLLKIKNKYGKNAILKAMDLQEGATAIMRNKQIGGHRSE